MRIAGTAELEHYYDALINMPIIAFCVEDDKGICAVGGLSWEQGLCWLFLDVKRKPGLAGVKLFNGLRRLKKVAAAIGEKTIYATRDTDCCTSERVLSTLGFRLYRNENGAEVWTLDA